MARRVIKRIGRVASLMVAMVPRLRVQKILPLTLGVPLIAARVVLTVRPRTPRLGIELKAVVPETWYSFDVVVFFPFRGRGGVVRTPG